MKNKKETAQSWEERFREGFYHIRQVTDLEKWCEEFIRQEVSQARAEAREDFYNLIDQATVQHSESKARSISVAKIKGIFDSLKQYNDEK